MSHQSSLHPQNDLLTRIGFASNWTLTAAGQLRNSPKVSNLIRVVFDADRVVRAGFNLCSTFQLV